MDTHTVAAPTINFDNSFARAMDGFYVPCEAAGVSAPQLLLFNHDLAQELGLDATVLASDAGTAIFSGQSVPEGAAPLAQVYAGHQFGHLSPQLGDGRALLLGEIADTLGQRRDIQLKGSGPTPFSRNGDGLAALGPVLREYLMGEAMHALGIRTTRALAAVATGDLVYRETKLPGAILTRIASSHMRVGTFQYFAARNEQDKVKQLADYAIDRHYPDVRQAPNPYLAFFNKVVKAQANLIAHWMNVGFIHGVMNTDNMTISGETIDYGPCAFMDAFNPETCFSSIDTQGRYAFEQQPPIGQWNLTRLAETLLPLINEDQEKAVEILTEALNAYGDLYQGAWLNRAVAKIGFSSPSEENHGLVSSLFSLMVSDAADFTQVFRRLSDVLRGNGVPVQLLFKNQSGLNDWLAQWQSRLDREDGIIADVANEMDRINPIYIPRNHKVEEALDAAVRDGDLTLFNSLLDLVSAPFAERPGMEAYTRPAPKSPVPYQTFCGT
ncbi:MAG: hypothetical protein CBD27_06915 [Rhodospirillaceae bacterium TMED167]|nr:hypothetical protein [Rhodospirillaceae bacterium]OUW27164.1 MAG: hypothetical protein CBD27_06915 [Rhodospirillaceae bacterium TMED167]